ncbi:hypothetical protein BRADI_4g26125v3 [Brachypodium distachyon]|uniref:Uncharacterized protein n=1 Tax=Brachypodium distachyon TaxID=15368 RepID=A0A2K2CQB1_BRADI|nr:hypothetical protein BRADI_4g26125v3 [Brachypodium distachyon]
MQLLRFDSFLISNNREIFQEALDKGEGREQTLIFIFMNSFPSCPPNSPQGRQNNSKITLRRRLHQHE